MPKLQQPSSQSEISGFQKAMSKVIDRAVSGMLARPVGITTNYIPKATDSAQVESIQQNLRGIAFRNDWTPVVLPGDDCGCGGVVSAGSIKKAQAAREAAFRREASTARFSAFMSTPTDQDRLNNPAQKSFVEQRQLTIPNTRQQFYAFMHALSAAFGSVDA